MIERIAGPVRALAFAADVRELWCAHAHVVARRGWPDLELRGVIALAGVSSLWGPSRDGTVVASTPTGAVELDASGRVTRRIDDERVIAACVARNGALVVVSVAPRVREGKADVLLLRVAVSDDDEDTRVVPVPAAASGTRRINSVALVAAPSSAPVASHGRERAPVVILAPDDAEPHVVDLDSGAIEGVWRAWTPYYRSRMRAFGTQQQSGWLSVDAAADGRCLVASDKGEETTVVWLDDTRMRPRAFLNESDARADLANTHGERSDDASDDAIVIEAHPYVGLAKKQREPYPEDVALGRFVQKGPSRGAAAAVHPTRDEVVFVDISGRLFHNDARTGALLTLVPGTFDAGYRFDV